MSCAMAASSSGASGCRSMRSTSASRAISASHGRSGCRRVISSLRKVARMVTGTTQVARSRYEVAASVSASAQCRSSSCTTSGARSARRPKMVEQRFVQARLGPDAVLRCRLASAQRGCQPRQVGRRAAGQGGDRRGALLGDERAEDLGVRCKGQGRIADRDAAAEEDAAALLGGELARPVQQSRLADPGFTPDDDVARRSGTRRREGRQQLVDHRRTTDHLGAGHPARHGDDHRGVPRGIARARVSHHLRRRRDRRAGPGDDGG